MSSEHGANKRHHNPVDSICRKIKSIQMMDQVSNPALQIPKFQSRNFDSPQCNIKKNLEEILKKITSRSHDSTDQYLISPSSDSVFSADMQVLSPYLRRISDSHSASATFSVIKSKERSRNSWMPVCHVEDCSPYYFRSRDANTQNKIWTITNLSFIGWKQPVGYRADNMYDVSLICEEDLLTTIFCACDIEHTGLTVAFHGKVAVSKIVDYLRHTTSRGSEDSGLEELCNMLDPDQKDVSVDLETYHAIMKEWIEDCKRKCFCETRRVKSSPVACTFRTLEQRWYQDTDCSMNVTSGSLEAFGGDVSKGDMETSDLITCVADLQYNNQKLQEENNKLKLTLEAVDETNNKLLADNKDLHQQIKSIQHFVLKAKSLEEELEEAKNNLNLSEEMRQQILCQNKQFFSPQSLQKEQDIKELKLTIVECSSIIETLRAEKSKLLENMQHMQQELISNGLSFPLCKFNSNIPEGMNSLHCELELAQSSETLCIKNRLNIVTHLPSLLLIVLDVGDETKRWSRETNSHHVNWGSGLLSGSAHLTTWQLSFKIPQVLKQELGEKRHLWIKKLHLLEKYKESLDKDFIRMAGNLRRTKTEQLHLRRELSARYCFKACVSLGFVGCLAVWGGGGQGVEAFHSACEEAASLKCKLEEAISEQQKLKDVNAALTSTCQLLQEKAEFLRLSLGFKCDLFTLDKRVRLEERSRDLAEENLKKEITNALKMLEALVPLCEEDNQAQEIIKKLQKSLQFLSQYAARVASRAEMLGAINQESRVSKAVEVMIQHVENLKRMYAKEHAELEELKQVLLQNERSFSPSSSLRRVSIATLPRSAGNAGKYYLKYDRGRLGAKQNEKRPSLQRFISTYSWQHPLRCVCRVGWCNLMSSWASHFKTSFSSANKTLWVSVSILVLLAALTSFLTGLSLQRPADAAPVGTGDSWTSLQQLLWPYTGLQHNGPPPV
uniref:Inositol 1,4,5-triphosphate receptor associated 2 n=1 Tax=Bubo bubo TaxID=30461 RepID=A0A8C0EXE3_BUBBB